MTNRKGFFNASDNPFKCQGQRTTGFPDEDSNPSYYGPNAQAAVMQTLKLSKFFLFKSSSFQNRLTNLT